MYNVNRQNVHKIKSKIYVSKKLESTTDDYGNEIPQYATPIPYTFNVQGISESSDIREFGENANNMKKCVITQKNKYLGEFKEFDKVYIYNNPDGEIKNGNNADYRIYSVREQNTVIVIYFLKLIKSQ